MLAPRRHYEDEEGPDVPRRAAGDRSARLAGSAVAGNRPQRNRRSRDKGHLTLVAPAAAAVRTASPVQVSGELVLPRDVLALPHVTGDVPDNLSITAKRENGLIMQASIAEGLVNAGAIEKNLPWAGTLDQTLHNGIDAWVNQRMKATEFAILDLGFVYTDNIQTAHFESEPWREYFRVPQSRTIGAFMLFADECGAATVGPRIEWLEKLSPGCGFNILAMIDRALWATIEGATPSWALSMKDHPKYDETADWFEEHAETEYPDPVEREAARRELVTEENILRHCPREACLAQYDWKFIKRGWLRARRLMKNPAINTFEGLDTALEILDMARQLHERLVVWRARSKGASSHLEVVQSNVYWEQVLPVCVRWSEEDMLFRLIDETNYDIANSGEETQVVYMQAFDPTLPSLHYGSLARAAQNMAAVMEILRLTDGLMKRLDGAPITLSNFVKIENIQSAVTELMQFQETEIRERARIRV